MATADIKRVIKIGGSLAIILPAQWAKGRVKPGQEMVVVGNGELRIFPVHEQLGVRPHFVRGQVNGKTDVARAETTALATAAREEESEYQG